MHGGSGLPATAIAPALDAPTPGGPASPSAPAGPQPPTGSPAPLPPPPGAQGAAASQSPNAPQPPAGSPAPAADASAYGYPQPPAGAPAPFPPSANAPQPPAGAPAPLPPPPGAQGATAVPSANGPQPPAGSPAPAADASAYGYPQPPAGQSQPPAGSSAPFPPPGAQGAPGAQSQPPAGSPAPFPPPSGAQSANGPQSSAGSPLPGEQGAPGAQSQPPAGSPAPFPPPPGAQSQPSAGSPSPGAQGTSAAPSANGPQPPAGSPAPDASAYGYPQPPAAHAAGDIADAATRKAGPGTPPPSGPGAPGTPAGGYVPTQLVSSLGPDGPKPPAPPAAPAAPGTPPGGVHHAATMLADPSMGGGIKPPGAPGAPGAPQPPGPPGAPGAPQPPGPPGTPPGGVHHAATMLADPSMGGGIKPPGAPGAPGAPQPPGPPGAPGAPGAPQPPGPPGGGVHHAATMLAGPAVGGPGAPGMPPPPAPGQHAPGPGMPGAPGGQPYGYPQPPTGQPTVGPGYQAVLRYRAADGSEQQLIRRSAPGTPHPEWQILHELRGMNVPPQQVLELHTELESCELPGAYCARMIRETWPQARITSIAPYGRDHTSRQQGMQQLLAHQGELHQVADGPARPAPVRAPLQQMPPAQPIPPEGVAQELAAAFGPGIFRFDQRAVSRQGVPDIVAHTLVVAGLPVDFGPFFWAQAQPGRPVPTLAELAQERGVQPASDAGSYLVMGSDFGRALCVQYGTANIVAVPVEAGPGGAPVPPQFVNTGLPEFARCMALLGRMWRLRFGLNQEQAGRWTVDFQNQLAALDPAALASPESWWSVLLEQMWDGLL
ncbi:SUKH-4 family immunity protein [Streptomyces venezuelae]|uniref:SUKH-4 family immunity protein n=1 Tax=Streptomyces venezuelae TaxID=54571 RepID=UPI00378F92A9